MRLSFLPIFLALFCLQFIFSQVQGEPGDVPFTNSIRQVNAAPLGGAKASQQPFISRRNLQASETAATIEFEVVLKMRNLSDLRTRLGHRQRFTVQEMAATYHPLPGNARAVSDWLTRKGFTITKTDPQNLAIFARGTVEQIQKTMGVAFARVDYDNKQYTSAITAPSIPATLAPFILGINGLQPHVTLKKNIVLKPSSLSDPNPPYTPAQIADAYDATPLYNSGITGAGQTTAVVIDTFPNTTDLQTFWTLCGINQSLSNIQMIQVVDGTLPAPSGEETLDTQWASSIAPGSKVRVYAATSLAFTDIDQCYSRVYNDAIDPAGYGIHQMTLSYGAPENMVSTSQLDTDAQYFANLASAGVTVFAASGDQGANPDPNFGGSLGLSPETPASDPNVTSVGGTSLFLDANNVPTGETVWNNQYGASGGGVSTYFLRPAWQVGNGLPSGLTRVVPDIAAAGDPVTGGLVCLNGNLYQYGGTSWSSPTWAGFGALLNQKRALGGAAPLGALNAYLYPLIGTLNFQDITSGNNNSNGLTGFQATAGYDVCTGLGTPHLAFLAQSLSGSSALQAPILTSSRALYGMAGIAFSYQITANQTPTSFGVTGNLPTGVSLDITTGLLSGTPSVSGTFPLVLTATNAAGTGSLSVKLQVIPNAPRFFVSDYETNTIGAFTTIGDTLNPALIKRSDGPNAIAVGGSYLYVASYGGTSVDKYTTAGQLVKRGLIQGYQTIAGIAVSGRFLYVLSYYPGLYVNSGTIDRYTLDGVLTRDYLGNPLPGYPASTFPVNGLIDPVGIAVAEPYLYVATASKDGSTGGISQYTTSGAVLNTNFVSGLTSYPWGIAASSSAVYITNRFTGTVSSYSPLGRILNATLISGLEDPWGISLTGSTLLISDISTGQVGSYTTDGATINDSLITGLKTPTGIAADPTEGEVDEQVITFPAITNHYQTAGSFTFTPPTSSSGLPVTLTINSGPVTISGTTITPTGTGLVTLTASQPGNALFHAAPDVTITFHIYNPRQTITFPDFILQVGIPFTMTATASSGLPVTYQLPNGTAATLSGNVITGNSISSVIVIATQVGTDSYEAVSVSKVVHVSGKTQTITPFVPIPYQHSIATPITITLPTSSSGLPVIVKVKSGPAVLSGNTLTLTGSGTVTLTATQAGNSTYIAAAQVTTSFNVMVAPVLKAVTFSRMVGTPFSIQVPASNAPTSYTLTGTLPAGASLDTTTGIISGTIANSGTYSFKITATNETGSATATIKLGMLDNVPMIFALSFDLGTVSLYSRTGELLNANLLTSGTSPSCIGISGSSLYILHGGIISQYKTTGELVNASLITNLHGFDFAISGSRIFAFDSETSVSEYNTAGQLVHPGIITGLNPSVLSLTVSGDSLYVGTTNPSNGSGTIGRYTTAGTEINAKLIRNLNGINDVVVAGSNLYVAQSTTSLYTTDGVLINASLFADHTVGLFATNSSLFAAKYDGTLNEYTSTGAVVKSPMVTGLSSTVNFVIGRPVTGDTAQTITLPALPNVPFSATPISLGTTASSGLPIDYSVSGPATVVNGVLTLTGIGTVTIVANQDGDGTYAPAPQVTATFTVSKNSQTIAFPAIPAQTFGGSPLTLNATASSGLPISYTVEGPASISGNVLTVTALGTVTVTARQAGNANYNYAPAVKVSFKVIKGSQTIIFPAIAAQVFGGTPLTLNATASSGLPVTFTAEGPATIVGNVLMTTAVGSVSVTAQQAGNANYNAASAVKVSFKVNKASQSITFPAIAAQVFGGTPLTLNATASSGLPVTFTAEGPATIVGNVLTTTGAGTVSVTARQAGDANYNYATAVKVSFKVGKGAQTITFPAIPAQTYGGAPVTLNATASSGLPVAYTVEGPATIAGNVLTTTGAGTVSVTARQAGNTNYNYAAAVKVTFKITPANAGGGV